MALLQPMTRLSCRDDAMGLCKDPPTSQSPGDQAAVVYQLFARSCIRTAFEVEPGLTLS